MHNICTRVNYSVTRSEITFEMMKFKKILVYTIIGVYKVLCIQHFSSHKTSKEVRKSTTKGDMKEIDLSDLPGRSSYS